MCAEGAAWSSMVGLGESYLPAFVLAMSANELAAGLVATVPMLFGAVLQLTAPWGVVRLRSYRKWVIACAVIQSLSFFPLIAMAAVGRISVAWTFLVASVYWATNLGMGPAWNAWAETLVPLKIRPRYFARRARLGQIGLLLGFAVGGMLLEGGTRVGRGAYAFATLFLLAAVSRLVSAYFLRCQREPVPLASPGTSANKQSLLAGGRTNLAGPILRFVLAMQMATWIAGPYFTPYMLVYLGLSYSEFMFLTCTAFLAKVLVLPLMGHICGRVGATRVLMVNGVSVAVIPILWMLSNSLPYLFAIQVLSGIVWAGFELATLLLFFEKIPALQRMATLTLFNLANAAAIVLGSCLGAVVLASLDSTPGAYLALFFCSGVARVLALVTLTEIRLPRMSSWRLVTRSLTMTPAVGSIDRPVLGTFDTDMQPALESAFDRILASKAREVQTESTALNRKHEPLRQAIESVSQQEPY